MSMAKKRTGSRHKPRKSISLSPMLYGQLEKLADRYERPIIWQIRIILREALRGEGLWPVPGQPDRDEQEPEEQPPNKR